MKCLFLLSVLLTFIVCIYAADYQWGECGSKDYLIAKDKVTKRGTFGLVKKEKYVLKQKSTNAMTITCIIITDRKKKCNASVVLENGGIGSKGCTLKFKSKIGGCINSEVKTYGR